MLNICKITKELWEFLHKQVYTTCSYDTLSPSNKFLDVLYSSRNALFNDFDIIHSANFDSNCSFIQSYIAATCFDVIPSSRSSTTFKS
jgi:hypothetical protein